MSLSVRRFAPSFCGEVSGIALRRLDDAGANEELRAHDAVLARRITAGSMPTIAVVDGVKIQMFYDDHTPPYFHATIGGQEVLIAIRTLDVVQGSLPPAS